MTMTKNLTTTYQKTEPGEVEVLKSKILVKPVRIPISKEFYEFLEQNGWI